MLELETILSEAAEKFPGEGLENTEELTTRVAALLRIADMARKENKNLRTQLRCLLAPATNPSPLDDTEVGLLDRCE